jgi:hypothetical protein
MIIRKRQIDEEITIKNLFERLAIEDKELALSSVPFPLEVETPYGFKKIVTAFRTEKQQSITSYFRNNITLKTSAHHRLKVNGGWKEVKNITENDVVETKTGTTSIVKKHFNNEEILYDISVEEVHCYYSNGILSHNSWILASIGASAMKRGLNTMHYTLELNENYVGLRYDCCFTAINFQDIKKNVDVVKQKLSTIDGKLFVKYFPLKTVSAQGLKIHFERLMMLENIKPDVIVVDYADLIRPIEKDKNANSYSEAGNVYEELRMIAGELGIPIWSASQTNRCLSLDTKVLEKNKGEVNISEIVEGDEILTHKNYKKVTKVFPQEVQPVYRIKLKSGKYIDCSANHLFPINTFEGPLFNILSGLKLNDSLVLLDGSVDCIENISSIGDLPTVDITVEDTHMFFANGIYTHNSGATENIVEGHNIADSYRKIMTADFVMSISRNKEDKVNHTARAHIIKNRFGPDGLTLYSKMNANNGQIDIYDADSRESQQIKSIMEAGEENSQNHVKKQLASKWRGYREEEQGNDTDL